MEDTPTAEHRIISIQPANTPSGDYDVHKPLPYPYHLIVADFGDEDERGRFDPLPVDRQDFWRGDPEKLVGFQRGGVQEVVLWPGDFVDDPESCVGLCPVFIDQHGGMFTLTTPITSVSVREAVPSR